MSQTLKDIIINDLISKTLISEVNFGDTVPVLRDIYTNVTTQLDTLFDVTKVPSFEYKELSSISKYNQEIAKIQLWLSATSISLTSILTEHQRLSDKYLLICERINNEFDLFNSKFGSLLGYTCNKISTLQSKQDPQSNVSKIGPYAVLPYFLNTVKMYDGVINISATASDTVAFSSMESNQQIPFTKPASLRMSSINKNLQLTVNINFNQTLANMIYIRFLNDVVSVDMRLYNNQILVYEGVSNRSDCLFNFLPLSFDLMTLNITCNNPNVAKYFSLQIEDIQVFQQINFTKYGTFLSIPELLGSSAGLTSVSLTHTNYNDLSTTNVDQNISISITPDASFFNRVDKNYLIDISTYKYTHSLALDRFTAMLDEQQVNLVSSVTGSKISKTFYKVPVEKTDPVLWDINYTDALVYYGLNKDYCVNTASISKLTDPYENWTKVGNYYKTFVANFEDGAIVDMGAKTCKINGKNVTGQIIMPVGISLIEVHMNDIDFRFGNKIENDKFNGIVNQATVESDPLYPLNFAYIFAGLPDYTGYKGGILNDNYEERSFNIDGISNLFLNEAIIPLSVQVTDSRGIQYALELAKAPATQGSFTIEPYRGRIKIKPFTDASGLLIDKEIKVRYRKANAGVRPCGIMFNRLLTFIPLKSMTGVITSESSDAETFFTLDGDINSKVILLPYVSSQTVTPGSISHAHLSYNTNTEKIYTAVRLDLQTTSKYLTPIVDNIFVAGK